jgi:tyrosinase
MFIFFFEEIVRETVIEIEGPNDWALPYWNYGLPGPHATLPRPFRNPKLANGEPNPLYESARAPGINSGAALSPQVTSPIEALARPHFVGAAEFGGGVTPAAQFSQQTGRLENTPHNAVHVAVGGPNGLMSNTLAAAQDPIFWLHHANIDRLWTIWNRTQGHVDPTEPEWTGHGFVFFNKKSQEVEMACENVTDPANALHYTYQEPRLFPSGVERPPIGGLKVTEPKRGEERPQLVGATSKAIELVGQPVTVEVPIDATAAGELKPDQHVYLNVENIEGKRNPGVIYGIYVELPPDAGRDLEAAHHVGNLTFFGIEGARNPEGDEHAHGLRGAMEISKFAHQLAAHGSWGSHSLSVTFRPVGLTPPEVPDPHDLVALPEHQEAPVTIGRVSVFYDA